MARQRHYRNPVDPGVCVFATTAVLDYVPVFFQDRLARIAIRELVRMHAKHEAKLHAFVLMPEHLHLLSTMPRHMNSIQFVGDLKSKMADAILPHLDEATQAGFAMQIGLGRRVFWKRSFRAFEVEGDDVFWQKVQYIHLNPVRRGLVTYAEDYRWSSARLFLAGKWRGKEGLSFALGDLDPQ
ncbi:MAG TPA: transposase [Fimbriimonadaceae bacterium]|nr:transposase [Fimbriimonadaceae bacterium]